MPELNVSTEVPEWAWRAFQALAKGRRRSPESVAAELLQEAIIRATDEFMIELASRDAQRAPFRIRDTERLIKELRERRRGKATNGKAKKARSGRA